MENTNPFLGANYYEALANCEQGVERNQGVIQEAVEEDVEVGLKSVSDEGVRRELGYRAAVQHNLMHFKYAGGSAVFDPQSRKDSSASGSAFHVDSGDDQHQVEKEFRDGEPDGITSLDDAAVASEDQSNGTFQLCFIAPKSIAHCVAFVKHEVNGAWGDAEPVRFHHEPSLDTFSFSYNFWFSEALPQQEDRHAEIAYHMTVSDAHVSSGFNINNFLEKLAQRPEFERVVTSVVKEKRLSCRFDVVNDRGEVLRKDMLGVAQWMAVLTQMIYVVNPGNVVDCVREYLRVATELKLREFRGFSSHQGPLLGKVVKWGSEVADSYNQVGPKMFLLSLGLISLLKELSRHEDCHPEKLHEAYEVVLFSLYKFLASGCGYEPPPFPKRTIQEGISELVARISRFSFNWMSNLEVLGRFDPKGIFLQRVADFHVNMRDVATRKSVELSYRRAVASMVSTNETFAKGKILRRVVYRKALMAAPTFPVFLAASLDLELWMSGATDWDTLTENLEEGTCAELEDGLHQWFTKVMPEVNSFRPKSTFVQQHLELIVAHVVWKRVDENSLVLPGFLAGSFRGHVAEMVLEMMSLRSGNGKKLSADDLGSVVETTRGVLSNYPFTFTLPLLPVECHVLQKLASSEYDEVYNVSKLVIQKVGDQELTESNVEYLTKEVLRPWLMASIKRGGRQPQSYSPLSYFRCVQDLLDSGVPASSVLGRCLTQAAVASSQQQSRGLHNFLAEVENTSQLHESLQVQYKSAVVTMILVQLQSAPNTADLDRISEQILRGLCSRHGQGVLTAKEKAKRNLKRMTSHSLRQRTTSSREKIQVELCVALLNEMAANAGFVENLTERAFQTISTSNFASCLLQIPAPPAPIREHWIYMKVQEACYSFGSLVEKGEVTLGTIESVSHAHDKWGSILKSLGYKTAYVALEDAFRKLKLYKKRLEACDILVIFSGFLTGRRYPIQGISTWSSELTARKEKWRSTPLVMLTDSHWPMEAHPSLFRNLESLLLLYNSEIFKFILLESCKALFERLIAEGKVLPALVDIDDGADSSSSATPDATFAMVAGELVPRAIETYRVEMEPYCGKKNLEKMYMNKLYSLWVTVDARHIETEFDLARRELNLKQADSKSSSVFGFFWGKEVDMVELIQAWKAIKAKGTLVEALPKVGRLFQFDESCEGYLEKLTHLMRECDENCTLKEFSDLHKKEGKALLAKISANEEIALIQLAKSQPLIDFLKDKLDEDFRNLIDAVEEGSDNDFVQQSILSDLIDLHRMFRPVLKSRCPSFDELRNVMIKELRASSASESASASTLAAKLNVCNENVAQITRFLSSVANRGLKMKDHMKRILRGGRYHFNASDHTLCSLNLRCGDTGIRIDAPIFETELVKRAETTVYNLAELQDLRSRARLVLSTHKAQAKRFGTDQPDSSDAETEKDTGLFIEQVDIVEGLVTSITELCYSGHFRYAQFNRVVSGMQELQALVRTVDTELKEWYAAVKEARSANYCLNYFRSVELRLMLEVLNERSENREEVGMCVELLQWAGIQNPKAALDVARRNFVLLNRKSRVATTSSLSASLMLIAKSLDPLFHVPELMGSASSSGLMKSRSINRKHNAALVLALVDETQMEHEAVVSLFHKRVLSLRDVPRNVLLCSSSTTWEEIHLLLLRCFQRSEQDVGLFCIAYIEKLSPEVQAKFLAVLQEMVHEWEESNHRVPNYGEDCERLALVCCSKSEALLAVSHHLNVRVCHMGTLNSAEICNQLPAECSRMKVITSEIPGLGKTKKVHNMTQLGLVRTLCVSGSTSRDSLVSQLKTLNLQPESILHLDISSVVNPETFNVLLFELLVLGCLKSDFAGVFHLNTSNIHIEIGNTLGNELARSLPVCDWFQKEHLTWSLESLEVDDDPSCDMQVVCIYLHALELRELETKDLVFHGAARNVEALPVVQCRALLRRHFVDHMKEGNTMSFSILEMFVKFLACQLRSLTESIYFQVEMLQFMRAQANIRSYLVTSLLEVSRDLSLRSVKPWLHEQQLARGKVTDLTMESRFKGMLRWSDSNHLMIFFQCEGPISFLYRNATLLPESIIQLVSSQRLRTDPKKMPDYAAMSSHELWSNLWPILQITAPLFEPTYVLTADNFLKMALIALRVSAQVPVLIMGETGCGKTSLLRILAKYCGVEFSSITLHAGTSAEDIRAFIAVANHEARNGNNKVWAFLDEINACDHLGFLNGVICHHLMDGVPLHRDLVVLAACNPYRVHDIENSQTGFSPRELMNPGDVQRYNLAYRVHPLPEAMLDYVWDFGLLSRHDEQAYIEAMVKDRVKTQGHLFADLLVQSQAFARECHGEASVSLRDASRCISLYEFFDRDLHKRPLHRAGQFNRVRCRATLLAFSHCYHSRLATEEQRRNYRRMFASVWKLYEPLHGRDFNETTFAEHLRAEQLDLLNRMDVPAGIARNKAILENVFVTLVCMLNHIPVFVIGKPGSGKTLALQLIYGNLRGTESRDSYFQKLPQMYRFSYQGSESSTSEGIMKVFEKAQRCKKDNDGRDVLVVVVLDEVGLAEVSSHNPLKVLHELLEPEMPQQVAVVGISNWSLDAAKMNRAIHLSQPDPSEQDLYDTSIAILESYDTSNSETLHQSLRKELRGLAKSYHTYHACQTKPNFHGLRDFYSLIKSLQVKKSSVSWQLDGLVTAVWRNFGGSPDDVQRLSEILKENLGHEELLQQPPSVMDLVRENLQDKDARHLMLITTGDSAIGILEKFQKNVITIHGSKFKDDCSDDYSYLLLSIIILHMEAGRCILLRGVERLWSSLYDMLNQHYTTVAERRNCRIAIGAYSNPMCYVHDNFRCIVVVDSSQVSRLDPPFLNRFEKQVLAYENILTRIQKEAVIILKLWCELLAGLSTNSNHSSNAFKLQDLFAGFHEDTLPSLVLHHQTGLSEEISSTDSSEFALLLDRCKEDLLRTAHVDAMVRASLSARCKDNVLDLEKWTSLFFGEWQDQQGLKEFLETAIRDESMRENGRGLRVVISTRTIIHMPIRKFLSESDAQIEKLGDFSSERQLQTQIQIFLTGNSSLLILQADAVMDKEHIQHAKFLVEKTCADFQAQVSRPSQVKNIVLIIHTHREMESLTGFTFLSGWQQITLDQLQKEETDLRVFLDHSVADLVEAERIPLKEIMVKVLTWSFLCIKYPKSLDSAAYCQEMVQKICEDKELWGCFKSRALEWLVEYADPLWQASVASDRRLLSLSSSLQDAFLQHIEEELRDPIARLVYLLEKSSDLGSYFTMDAKKKEVWRATLLNAELVNIESVSVPRHPEGYHVQCPLSLSLPFVATYARHVDSGFQDLYLTQLSKTNEEKPASSSAARGTMEPVKVDLWDSITEIATDNRSVVPASTIMGQDIIATMRGQLSEFAVCVDTNPELYVQDFAKIYAPYKCDSRHEVEAQAFEWVVRGSLGTNRSPPSLHILLWEHGEKLKAQALLVASCLTESLVAEQLAQLKRKPMSPHEFDEYLLAQCYSAVLPQSEMTKEDFLQSVKLEQWVQNLELLIGLASPLAAFGWATLTSLEVLKELAFLALHSNLGMTAPLQGLVRWLGYHGTSFTPGQLLEAVLSLIRDQPEPLQRFLASFFRKILKGRTTTADVNTIAAFIFHLRDISSVMKNVILLLLDASLSHSLAYFEDARCPKYMQFLLNRRGSFLALGEVPFEGEDHVAFVLLSDIVYESINPSAMEALLRGEAAAEWSLKDFDLCLNRALELMDVDAGPLTVQVAAAFAFMRATLDAVACEVLSSTPCSSPTVSKLAKRVRESSGSLTRFSALKLYLLKVLHMKKGLSLVEISNVATRCDQIRELYDYSTVLQWDTMHEVSNPLGFDPFWCSSQVFEKAGEAIYNLASGNENRAARFFDRSGADQQKLITAAVASRLYLPSASRTQTAGERNASTWLHKTKSLHKWDSKWREAVYCFSQNDRLSASQWSNLKLTPTLLTQDLWFRTLAAHILLVVTGLPRTSPLQGYITLDREHLEAAYVLAAPNSPLAAFRTIIGKGKELGEYQCQCGTPYFVGECMKPMETITCTNCERLIGGTKHVPVSGTVKLEPLQIQNGYIVDNVSRSDTFYAVRNLDHKCYRALRLVLHFCMCIGVYRAVATESLRRLLGLQGQSTRPLEELRILIEEDFAKLDVLLACNRETTVKYMHLVVSFLSGMQSNVALSSPDARARWEAEFQRIFDNGSFESGAHKAAADYLERQKGNDRYSELVEERGPRLFPPALENILRITVAPSLANFRALYKQDAKMIEDNPLIQVFFHHEKDLEDLTHFVNLISFCNTAHEDFSFKISRPEAASMSMREALQQSSGLKRQFQQFAGSWNAIREKVKAYECKQLRIPIMNKDASLAMCLVEPRDHGLFIVALLEYLRGIQNAFLLDVAEAMGDTIPRKARVQACKTEDIVHYHKQWLENVVKEVAMADPRFGYGQQVLYDNVIIQEHLLRGLVKGKPQLTEADWLEFPYKYESFHRHATILADVASAIAQESLRPDTLQAVQREIESGGVGAGQFLEMMNLCLGFLRRTGGHQQQPLGTYCELWLGKDSAELISKSTVFDKICLKHIVSLYEGLEDSASNSIGRLVSQKYRAPLTSALVDDILASVKTENAWKDDTHVERIPVSAFLHVLRRFMFRYLSVDNLSKDVQLSIYLTNSTIAKWPADVVSDDIVEDCFPSTLTLQHSFATYMLLAEICKGGDWLKAGMSDGWIIRSEN